MNKKGGIGLTIISVIMFLIVGLMTVNFLFPEVTNARANLSCASPTTISDGTKLLCLVFDITIPAYIWAIIGILIGAITAKLLL